MFRFIKSLLINRVFTQFISHILDNYIPPVLRDNKYFMYPFFYLAYKGKNVKYFMEFKSNLYNLNKESLEEIYQGYNTIGTDRKTDLNRKSVKSILNNIDKKSENILDIACGNGYLVKQMIKEGYNVTGSDVFEDRKLGFHYVKSNIEDLPFKNNSFDIVTCTHTLEHVIDIKKATEELKRVAKRQIIIVVPCQRFFYYTIDLHIHFFPRKEMLISLIDLDNFSIKKIGGDWLYVGYL